MNIVKTLHYRPDYLLQLFEQMFWVEDDQLNLGLKFDVRTSKKSNTKIRQGLV